MKSEKTKPVEQLKKGDFFKAKRQKRWRMVLDAQILPQTENIPEKDRGKVLVSYALGCCRQAVFPVGEKVKVYEP